MKFSVITCSTRCAAGTREDTSGSALVEGLVRAGHEQAHRELVPDDIDLIRAAVRAARAAGARIVLTTGGTGPTPGDVTPEAVSPLLDREFPGIAEAIRASSREAVPTAILSRGIAGSIGDALVVTLPGSTGGVRDGLKVLIPVLDHVLDQLAGGDHTL